MATVISMWFELWLDPLIDSVGVKPGRSKTLDDWGLLCRSSLFSILCLNQKPRPQTISGQSLIQCQRKYFLATKYCLYVIRKIHKMIERFRKNGKKIFVAINKWNITYFLIYYIQFIYCGNRRSVWRLCPSFRRRIYSSRPGLLSLKEFFIYRRWGSLCW